MFSPRPSLELILTHAWLRRGPLACALWPLSLLFRMLTGLRRVLYRTGWLKSTRLPVPLIIVGNVFIGGTGKTPLTIWLVEALRQRGWMPGIISRGYGAKDAAARLVSPDAGPEQVGDEPVLMARRSRCPVMVGRDRVAAAQALLLAHPEVNVIVSDDGLQHYALARDVEIVLFDSRGGGNGWVLPAGPLREPLSRRRDFTVVNAFDLPEDMPADAFRMQLVGSMAERLTDSTQRVALSALQSNGQPTIVAAAGIGNPARFFDMLRAAGLVFEEMPLPDHYDFSENPFAQVSADIILITEKDAVKCLRIATLECDSRLWVVPVTACLDGALAEHIVEKCRGHSTT